jgi:hypothetical protein
MATKFDYLDARNTADELIQFFGMDAVLRRTGASPEDRPCRIAFVENRPREKDTALSNPTDRNVIMSALNEEVQALPPDDELDVLVVNGEILRLTTPPKVTAPAGIAVCYEFTVR